MVSTQFIQIGLQIIEIFFMGLWNLYFYYFGTAFPHIEQCAIHSNLHGICQRSNTEYSNVGLQHDAKRIKTTPQLDRLLGYLANQASIAHLSIGKSCWIH